MILSFAHRKLLGMKLTSEQQTIIHLGYEHCVITAVAGSGKTTTLAHRICKLLLEGHDPERMLILMFNKSAKEDFEKKLPAVMNSLQDRASTSPVRLRLPEIRTYHAMGYRLYRRFIQEGFLPAIRPDILTEQETQHRLWSLIRAVAPEQERAELNRSKKEYIEEGLRFIELVKTTLHSPEEMWALNEERFTKKNLVAVFHAFEQWRKDQARITFSDMLWEPVKLIHQHPGLLKMVTNKMDLVLVDEYQDTNEIQHKLMTYIAGERARVTVVGDPDQTIYEFRGAQPEFILHRFAEDFPSPTELTLSYSFRYGHRVALMANHLIHHNRGRKNVICHAHESVEHTQVQRHSGGAQEILQLIQKTLQKDLTPGSIAILCRVWSQTVEIELGLLQAGIPYYSGENKGVLASRELQGMLVLLNWATHHDKVVPATEQQRRYAELLRFPHCGLNDEQLTQLSHWLSQKPEGLELMEHWPHWNALGNLQKHRLKAFSRAVSSMIADADRLPAAMLLTDYVKQTDMLAQVRSMSFTTESGEEKVNTLLALISFIRNLNLNPADTLTHFHWLREQAQKVRTQDGVNLTTIHRAKGLEWPTVVIPGLTDAMMPYHHKDDPVTPALLETERRLLYVAMTRARSSLHLFIPEAEQDMQSRFLTEMRIDESLWLASMLERNPEKTDVQVPETLTPLSSLSHTYAERQGTQLIEPVIKKRFLDRLSGKRTSYNPSGKRLWYQDRVRHAIFGVGQVIQELERSFSVRFNDGKEMEFSKKSAHLYFKPIE